MHNWRDAVFSSRRRANRFTAHFSAPFVGATALALAGVLSLGQIALADSTSGSVGDYLTTDSSTTPGATCKYTRDQSQPNLFWISSITAKAPAVWWPDRSTDSNTEHGKVGWRFNVAYDNGGGYHLETQSPVQKATAYEDSQSPYNMTNGTKAPLTKMTVSFNGKARTSVARWRVKVTIYWYRKNGTVMGSATHVVQYYNEHANNQTSPSGNPYCDGLLV
jgi:hypothetical protein